ncbi:MAG TPA: polysaccharide biosynthesis C-terminal domain-containing protein, partial [Bacillota bacterium]|nr:polysaccharide biosynthesis C-terminal domain-containing protein [Bacillota bacterium]
SILSGMGHVGDPLKSAVLGVTVKIALEFYLTSMHGLNVKGAALSTVAGSFVSVVMNLIQLERRLGFKVGYAKAFWRPMLASLVMGGIVYLTQGRVEALMGAGKVSALAGVGIGAFCYLLALMLLGGLNPDELEAIPLVGRKAAALSRRLGSIGGKRRC